MCRIDKNVPHFNLEQFICSWLYTTREPQSKLGKLLYKLFWSLFLYWIYRDSYIDITK